MTKNIVENMLACCRQYEAELNIIRDCSGAISEPELMKNERYSLLKQRAALVSHWLTFLSDEERFIIHHHMVEEKTWNEILDLDMEEKRLHRGCDRRTLQRTKSRAIGKILKLMNCIPMQSIKHLLPNEES